MARKKVQGGDEALGDEALGEFYRMLPSVNDLLLSEECRGLCDVYPRTSVLRAARFALAALRRNISAGQHTEASLRHNLATLVDEIEKQLRSAAQYSLRPVINATGVLLHTNLGRAPLSPAALDHLVEVAQGYCNLEFDLEAGERSRRDVHAESLVLRVLMDKSNIIASPDEYGVVIVNNCAAATFLALKALAEGTEVLISRGELVEIGGGFRIPEILEKSGAILKEVGTTNRTRIADYERALSSNTGLILRVHPSNFSMEGFVERPALSELIVLGRKASVTVFEDQGTGLITSLQDYGIDSEGSLLESFRQGADLVAASGDKLLGGPQCGILVGRKDLTERIRINPLLRTFRVDKLTYAALEATLIEHLSGTAANNPVARMLSIPPAQIMRRCQQIASRIDSPRLVTDVVPVMSLVGGGTAPKAGLPSCALSLRHVSMNAAALLVALRRFNPPIVARISEDTVLLDLRTVHPEFDAELISLLNSF